MMGNCYEMGESSEAGIQEYKINAYYGGTKGRETYIGNIGHLELARLSKVDAGCDHCACADGALVALAVEFLRPDVEDIVAHGERCSKHDAGLMRWPMQG